MQNGMVAGRKGRRRGRPHFEFTKGSARVRCYKIATHSGVVYCVAWYHCGKRHRKAFAHEKDAQAHAREVAGRITAGEPEMFLLTPVDRLRYMTALEALRPFNVTLDVAARDYAEAVKHLDGASLIEAAKDYAARHAKIVSVSVQQAVDELIEAKRKAGRSAVHLADLESRLGRFAATFQCKLESVEQAAIVEWLDNLRVEPRTRNNFQAAIASLYAFARKRNHLPKDHDPMDGIDRQNDAGGEIGTYTPAEMAAMLEAAPAQFVPVLVLSGFCGLRMAEIMRIGWDQVQIDKGVVRLERKHAKTNQKRLAPIPANAAQWLAPYVNQTGAVWPWSKPYLEEVKAKVSAKAGVPWRVNGLRHSFITYRTSTLRNLPQVALEAGNSPRIIQSNYLELATQEEGERWFGIVPKQASNIIPIASTP